MTQDTERVMAVFPRDTHEIIRATYSQALWTLIAVYPKHAQTREELQQVAEDLCAIFKQRFYTDDPQLLEWLYVNTFMSCWELTSILFDKYPEEHRRLATMPEDKREVWIAVLFAAWYKTHGKRYAAQAVLRK